MSKPQSVVTIGGGGGGVVLLLLLQQQPHPAVVKALVSLSLTRLIGDDTAAKAKPLMNELIYGERRLTVR